MFLISILVDTLRINIDVFVRVIINRRIIRNDVNINLGKNSCSEPIFVGAFSLLNFLRYDNQNPIR